MVELKKKQMASDGLAENKTTRPRSFNTAIALNQAMLTFWKFGYQGSSMPVLTKSMGIHPGNLYTNFGNKEHLFLKCIQLYQKEKRLHMVNYIKSNQLDPLTCLKGLIDQMLTNLDSDVEGKGCMMINAFLEIHLFNDLIKERIAIHFSEMRTIFKNLILEAQEYGQISKYRNSDGMAEMILNSLVGVHVFHRLPATRKQSESLYTELMENLR